MKYAAAYHKQVAQLLVKHGFQMLMESRINRTVRPHPRSTGKSYTAHDKFVELGNRLYAMFAKAKSLKGIIRNGTYVGLAQRAKKFIQRFYRPEKDEHLTTKSRKIIDGLIVPQAGYPSDQTPKRQFIYEAFTHIFKDESSDRQLTNKTVPNVKRLCKTKLVCEKLEKRMKEEAQEYTASRLLNGIHHIWGDLISNDNQADDLVVANDDGADVGGAVDNTERDQRRDQRVESLNALVVEVAMTEVTVSESRVDTGDEEMNKSSTNDVTGNKFGLHKDCLCNPWKDGLEKVKNNNHIMVTANMDACKDRKRSVLKLFVMIELVMVRSLVKK